MAQFGPFCTCRVAPSSGTLVVSGINIWERICSLLAWRRQAGLWPGLWYGTKKRLVRTHRIWVLNRWRNHLWAEPCTFNLDYHCVPFVKERGKEKGKENGKRRKRKGKKKGERKKGELTPEKGVTSTPLTFVGRAIYARMCCQCVSGLRHLCRDSVKDKYASVFWLEPSLRDKYAIGWHCPRWLRHLFSSLEVKKILSPKNFC